MSSESAMFKVFVVDDDPLILDVMRSILEPDCAVATFASAEECQRRLATEQPDMFLLDVGLPGMDGYAFCRQLKDDAAFRRIPVTFVSSHDTIEARLQGYDAGGEDFIVKPFEPPEVMRKLKVAQQIAGSQRALAEQVAAAESRSSLAIAGMDETGALLQFMSRLIVWNSAQEIAAGLLGLLQRYRLDGVVQTRLAHGTRTLSAAGADLPLQASVIDHVRGAGGRRELDKRSVHDFARVTLLVNDLPLEDPDYCVRLREHLAVAVQGVDSRLAAIDADEAHRRELDGFRVALESLAETIAACGEASGRDGAPGGACLAALQAVRQTLDDRLARLRGS